MPSTHGEGQPPAVPRQALILMGAQQHRRDKASAPSSAGAEPMTEAEAESCLTQGNMPKAGLHLVDLGPPGHLNEALA